jgi:hypothetical protein
LLAFWYLVCVALPLRHWLPRLLALVLFACAPAMAEYRFQPESITVAHLFIVLALIAMARARFTLVVLCGFGLMLTRGDGIVLFGLLVLGAIIAARRSTPPAPSALRLLALAGTCASVSVVWCFASFGTPVPPAAQTVPFLDSYGDIFTFGAAEAAKPRNVWRRFAWEHVVHSAHVTWFSLRYTSFTPAPHWWLLLAGVAGPLLWLRHRSFFAGFIWTLCFGGLFLVAWSAHMGFYLGRTPYPFTPLVILAGALAIDEIVAVLDTAVHAAPRWPVVLAANGALAALAALCAVFVVPLPPPHTVPGAKASGGYGSRLTPLNEILRGEPVASNVPWFVMAHTNSPTVSIPFNGEAAVAGVLTRYHIRWLVVFGAPRWVEGESRALLKNILAGTTTTVGSLRLERVPRVNVPAVFHVLHPSVDVRADEAVVR